MMRGNRSSRPADHAATAAAIRARAGGQCECVGECGLHRGRRCAERHGEQARFARSGRVLLELHDGKAWCQVCAELVRITARKRTKVAAQRYSQLEMKL